MEFVTIDAIIVTFVAITIKSDMEKSEKFKGVR